MLTIIIPTLNRPHFIERLLKYYASMVTPFSILIGDSSKGEMAFKVKEQVEHYQDRLNVSYHDCAQWNDSQTIKHLIYLANTPYAVFVADDDFLVPRGLKACVDFLQRHPDYAAAHGKGLIFNLDSSSVYGSFQVVGPYCQPILEQETSSQRLIAHLNNYRVILFSVHRLETWKCMYTNIESVSDKRFTELLPCCLSIIDGKVKQLDVLTLLRQGHDERYLLPDSYDWLTDVRWQSSYGVFIKTLSQALSQKETMSIDESQSIVKRSFWSYLAKGLNAGYRRKFAPSEIDYLKAKIKSMVLLDKPLKRLKGFVNGKNEFELENLLKKESVYHDGFISVYKIVTSKET